MNFALRIPDYYRKDIELLKGDISINQFIINALAEKIATLRTLNQLQQRANRGSRGHALELLRNAPDIKPQNNDMI